MKHLVLLAALVAGCGGDGGSTICCTDCDGVRTCGPGTACPGLACFPDGGPSTSGCPETEPTDGSPCPTFGLQCTYGDSLLPACRASFGCRGAAELTWSASAIDPACASPTDGCPPAPPAVDDPPVGRDLCAYPDGTVCIYAAAAPSPCMCAGLGWQCVRPSGSCPTTIPNAGTSCTEDELRCAYVAPYCAAGASDASDALDAICRSGSWVWSEESCRS